MNKAVCNCTTLSVETVGFLPILLAFSLPPILLTFSYVLACLHFYTHTHTHTHTHIHTHTHTGGWEIHPPRTHMLHKQKPSCAHLRVLDYTMQSWKNHAELPSILKEHKKDFKP